MRQSRFGQPLPLRAHSRESSFVIDPIGGYRLDQPISDLAPGFTPSSDNFVVNDYWIEPRPALMQRGSQYSWNTEDGVPT
jgi:hypothetical protein